MSEARPDPRGRFSNRVDDYVRSRPGYPRGVIEALRASFGLAASWTVADVGAGTGISAALFLEAGCSVVAVEPNDAMRAASITRLGANPRFRAVAAPAEATTLDGASVDAVVAAQAFHWFDKPRFRAEAARILKPGGIVALVWNVRRVDASPFAAGYEALVREFATDYLSVRHENVSDGDIAALFGGPYVTPVFDNVQVLDFEGVRGRLASSSYMPAPGTARHPAMIEALRTLFAKHERDGVVELPYDARLYAGRLTL